MTSHHDTQRSERAGAKRRDGAARIAAERQRQIRKEGWTKAHDRNEHDDGALALAAVAYASPEPVFVKRSQGGREILEDPMPFEWRDKRDDYAKPPTKAQRIDLLVKAGALIAAEIDRLMRSVP